VSPKLLVAALAAICLVGPAVPEADAQVTSAAIVGTITDNTGAALPGATVTARNVETGFVRAVPTNESGAYRLDFLPTGTYVVEVSLSGFKTERRSNIVLNVNDTARIDASLAVGGVTEAVTVSSHACR
jgi:carboxypeptidase family protein